MRDAFFKALYERAQRDPSVIVLTGDQSAFWLDKLAQDMPAQFLNCGIAEQNMIGVAAGLALNHRRVFVHGINNFLILRALEQISVDIVQHRANVTLVGVGAGYTYSTDGPTHHGVCDLGAALAIGLTVWNCSDPGTSEHYATHVNGPAYIRIEKGVLPELTTPHMSSLTIERQGNPMRITSGFMVHEALKLAGGVINVHRLPLEANLLRMACDGHAIEVIEDNNHGTLAKCVALALSDQMRTAHPTEFLHEYGSREFLHKKAGI